MFAANLYLTVHLCLLYFSYNCVKPHVFREKEVEMESVFLVHQGHLDHQDLSSTFKMWVHSWHASRFYPQLKNCLYICLLTTCLFLSTYQVLLNDTEGLYNFSGLFEPHGPLVSTFLTSPGLFRCSFLILAHANNYV